MSIKTLGISTRATRDRCAHVLLTLTATLSLLFTTAMSAQTLNTEVPNSVRDTGVLGEPQLIEADLGEGTELLRIALFYRFDDADYSSVSMQPGRQPGVYMVLVPTRDIQAEAMDYYIRAEDSAGNELLKGSSSVHH